MQFTISLWETLAKKLTATASDKQQISINLKNVVLPTPLPFLLLLSSTIKFKPSKLNLISLMTFWIGNVSLIIKLSINILQSHPFLFLFYQQETKN